MNNIGGCVASVKWNMCILEIWGRRNACWAVTPSGVQYRPEGGLYVVVHITFYPFSCHQRTFFCILLCLPPTHLRKILYTPFLNTFPLYIYIHLIVFYIVKCSMIY